MSRTSRRTTQSNLGSSISNGRGNSINAIPSEKQDESHSTSQNGSVDLNRICRSIRNEPPEVDFNDVVDDGFLYDAREKKNIQKPLSALSSLAALVSGITTEAESNTAKEFNQPYSETESQATKKNNTIHVPLSSMSTIAASITGIMNGSNTDILTEGLNNKTQHNNESKDIHIESIHL